MAVMVRDVYNFMDKIFVENLGDINKFQRDLDEAGREAFVIEWTNVAFEFRSRLETLVLQGEAWRDMAKLER